MIKHIFKGLIPSYTVILRAVQSYLKHSVPTPPKQYFWQFKPTLPSWTQLQLCEKYDLGSETLDMILNAHTHLKLLRLREMEGLVKNKDGIKSQAKYSLRFKLICAAHTGPFNEFEGKGDNFKGGSQSHMGEAVYAIPVFVLTPWKPPLSVCRWIRLNSNSHVIKSEPVSLNTHFMFMGGNMQHRGRCISSQGKGLK